MTVHSVLPGELTAAVDEVLATAGIQHIAHGYEDPLTSVEEAAPHALAIIGPYRSADVAEAAEITAPLGIALLAPAATRVGITRDDEPGCDDPADSRGTVLRLVARDTILVRRVVEEIGRAFVIVGDHDYGRQLDAQLRVAGLERVEDPDRARVVVLCGLAGEPEIGWARELAPLPVVGFDGIQGADLGDGRDVRIATACDPASDPPGIPESRRAAELVAEAIEGGAGNRVALLDALRTLGPFDDHGDPVEPRVWL